MHKKYINEEMFRVEKEFFQRVECEMRHDGSAITSTWDLDQQMCKDKEEKYAFQITLLFLGRGCSHPTVSS